MNLLYHQSSYFLLSKNVYLYYQKSYKKYNNSHLEPLKCKSSKNYNFAPDYFRNTTKYCLNETDLAFRPERKQ